MPEETNHEFTEFFLTEDELFNLQFTNLPSNPEDCFGNNEFYMGLASSPLWYVVEELKSEMHRKDSARPIEGARFRRPSRFQSIRQRYNQDNAELGRIFQELESSSAPWFERLVSIGKKFERERIDSGDNLILVRNLSITQIGERPQKGVVEKDKSPTCFYHIVDGNHRLLVYALYISCALMEYNPVKVIHATSWQHSEHKVFYNKAGNKWCDWKSQDLDSNGLIDETRRKERQIIEDEEKRELFFDKIKLPEEIRTSSAYFLSDRSNSTQNRYAIHNDNKSIVDEWPFQADRAYSA